MSDEDYKKLMDALREIRDLLKGIHIDHEAMRSHFGSSVSSLENAKRAIAWRLDELIAMVKKP